MRSLRNLILSSAEDKHWVALSIKPHDPVANPVVFGATELENVVGVGRIPPSS